MSKLNNKVVYISYYPYKIMHNYIIHTLHSSYEQSSAPIIVYFLFVIVIFVNYVYKHAISTQVSFGIAAITLLIKTTN